MSILIRFKGIIDTLANIAADRFAGRVAWATDIARMIWYYDSTSYGVMARRDIFETFAGIRNNGAYQDSLGVERISSGGVVTAAGVAAADLTSGQAVVSGAGGRLATQDAATFRETIDAQQSLPWIHYPSADPVRNHVDIIVPEDEGFIDNVLSIQNKSSGLWYGETSYGNAAINFKDSAGTERCAVGYSRNSAIQPNGYIADTLYAEIGNPFAADAQATYFRVMATIAAGSPYWGGGFKQWAPLTISSRTGEVTVDLGNGGEDLNVVGGGLTIGTTDDVRALNFPLTNSFARLREYGWANAFGLTTNVLNTSEPYTLDDATKSGWILGLGYGSGVGEFDSFRLQRIAPGESTATTLFRIDAAGKATTGAVQASNLSGSGVRPLVADASGNVDDQDAATFRATIGVQSVGRRLWAEKDKAQTYANNERSILGATSAQRKLAANTISDGTVVRLVAVGRFQASSSGSDLVVKLTCGPDGNYYSPYYLSSYGIPCAALTSDVGYKVEALLYFVGSGASAGVYVELTIQFVGAGGVVSTYRNATAPGSPLAVNGAIDRYLDVFFQVSGGTSSYSDITPTHSFAEIITP